MSGRVRAETAVFALAIIMIIAGAWGIWRGSAYVQLEWGWTSVISGSVALTGGVLTLALGFVLRRLDALHGALLAMPAHASAIAAPEEAPAAAMEVAAPLPLGAEPMPAQPEAAPPPAYVDPALVAAEAINLELLQHEEPRPAAAAPADAPAAQELQAPEPAARSESPPEIVHAADQGPADDMVRAAGVSDEPELDAAIEQLLAEERLPAAATPEAAQGAPPVSIEPAAEIPEAPIPPPGAEPERPVQRAGVWRGLFSRKERRAAPPPADQPSIEPEETRAEAEPPPAAPEPAHPAAPAVHADTIPRTGDDWFDRALSGLDEVYEPSGEPAGEQPHHGDHRDEVAGSEFETHPPPRQEEPPAAAPPAEPAVIGRYTSGNTTYVMFADGSIEAETPNGVLRFASLADLKVYVEGGQ